MKMIVSDIFLTPRQRICRPERSPQICVSDQEMAAMKALPRRNASSTLFESRFGLKPPPDCAFRHVRVLGPQNARRARRARSKTASVHIQHQPGLGDEEPDRGPQPPVQQPRILLLTLRDCAYTVVSPPLGALSANDRCDRAKESRAKSPNYSAHACFPGTPSRSGRRHVEPTLCCRGIEGSPIPHPQYSVGGDTQTARRNNKKKRCSSPSHASLSPFRRFSLTQTLDERRATARCPGKAGT